jgi:hypothetical protein
MTIAFTIGESSVDFRMPMERLEQSSPPSMWVEAYVIGIIILVFFLDWFDDRAAFGSKRPDIWKGPTICSKGWDG